MLITGNTYPVREKLKELGAVWSPKEKGWRVPKVKAMAAQVIVQNARNSWEEEESNGKD